MNRKDPEWHILDGFLNFYFPSAMIIWGGPRDRLGTKTTSPSYTDGGRYDTTDADDRYPHEKT